MARFVQAADRAEWEVRDVRGSNKMGWYYTTNIPSPNGVVVVKLTRHGTHFCHVCVKSDACQHSAFVSSYIDVHGIPSEV